MRKVKVAALLLCSLTPALLGGFRIDTAYSVTAGCPLKNEIVRVNTRAAAGASIMADTIAMTIWKPVNAVSSETTAETTTESETRTTTTEEETTTTESETTTTTTTAETETTTTTTTTMTTTTTAATTTTTAATAAAIAASPVLMQESVSTEAPVTASTAPQTTQSSETAATSTEPARTERPITDAEYIMICNVVGHEYGANWISEYDKALIVEVIMNRVNSPQFPDTVYGVLMQRGQFPGLSRLVNQGYFSSQVTDSVKKAVDLYFADPSQFRHGYLFYTGDGYRNYFRTKY